MGLKETASVTIAIPTYNRPIALRDNLEHLLQTNDLGDSFRIVIADNSEGHDTAGIVSDLEARYGCRIQYSRNRSNIGAGANVLALLAGVETDWVWLLGDDDRVEAGALSKIRDDIAAYSEAVAVNYCTPAVQRDSTKVLRGASHFIREMDHFGNILSISASLFKTKALIRHLNVGYRYIYSMAPHLAMLLAALEKDGMVVLKGTSLITSTCTHGRETHWSYVAAARAMYTFAEPIYDDRDRSLLIRHISSLVSLEAVAYELFFERQRGRTTQWCKEMMRRVLLGRRGVPGIRGRGMLYGFLLHRPAAGIWLFEMYWKMRGSGRVPAPVDKAG